MRPRISTIPARSNPPPPRRPQNLVRIRSLNLDFFWETIWDPGKNVAGSMFNHVGERCGTPLGTNVGKIVQRGSLRNDLQIRTFDVWPRSGFFLCTYLDESGSLWEPLLYCRLLAKKAQRVLHPSQLGFRSNPLGSPVWPLIIVIIIITIIVDHHHHQ